MIQEWLAPWHPITQAFAAGLFTWAITAAGAAVVFLFQETKPTLQGFMEGFAAGVMIAASFWSLLAPAIEMAETGPTPSWFPPAVGFVTGGLFLALADRLLPHLHAGQPREAAEGIHTHWNRSVLLVLAITLHNIPEGLAVGFAFGAAYAEMPAATLGGAVVLAIGIGLQNFPEGLAVAWPLRQGGWSRSKSFFYGQASGAVEPIAAVAGAAAVLAVQSLLPYALSFAAGAMIFVVVEELIPESHRRGHVDLATLGTIAGFTTMMWLDVALG